MELDPITTIFHAEWTFPERETCLTAGNCSQTHSECPKMPLEDTVYQHLLRRKRFQALAPSLQEEGVVDGDLFNTLLLVPAHLTSGA